MPEVYVSDEKTTTDYIGIYLACLKCGAFYNMAPFSTPIKFCMNCLTPIEASNIIYTIKEK